jgi:mono/diheme cytochrome c family protein
LNSIRELLVKWICALAVAAIAAAQPTRYSRDVAPILAMNCHLCHGANPDSAAGGLSTRTFAELMKGGNLGPVVIPRNPARSPLWQFVSGARGEAHRMPLGGPPLAPAEVEMIRRWIAEGANADRDESRPHRLSLPSVRLEPGAPLRLRARVSVAAYVSLELARPRGSVLYLDGGAVRADRGVAAIGAPGEWLEWTLRRAPDWPGEVRVTLTIEHTRSEPVDAELIAGTQRATLR